MRFKESTRNFTNIRLPIWLITERKHILNPPPNIPCADPDAVHAFTSADKLTAFLEARQGGRWDVNEVGDRQSVLLVVAQLHGQAVFNVCFDPNPDGSGGTTVKISELLAAFNSNTVLGP